MKLAIALLAIAACVLARPDHQVDDHHVVNKQQDVWEVLKYIHNPIYHKEHAQIAQTYSLEANAQHYKNDVYQHFAQIHESRFLQKGEIFSIFNEKHVQQAEALFKLFYYADSYQIFHQTALWARQHLNEGLFVYSYAVAVVHRPDTQDVVLPPVYEIFPHYFFNSEVIQKAYQLKMGHYENQEHQHEGSHQNQVKYTIHSNYSGQYLNIDPEQSLSYYLEDAGINAYYFYYNLYHPYWMDSEEFHLQRNRGEIFYYLHQQLFARYHLERLSHGVGEVEYFNWDVPFKTGYYPSLTYPNGLAFPERPHFANLKEYIHYYGQRRCDKSNYGLSYSYVQTYEQRIREAIDSGFVIDHEGNKHQLYTEEGINILGHIIEGTASSPNYRYYGSYVNMARHLLGYSKEPLNHHKLAPSALEHYSTSLRDPAFYQMFKKVLLLVDQYKQNLPAYQHKHLYQQAFEVNQVEIEPLVTYYDNFYADITNGLYVTPEEYETDSFRVRVHQYRLNHKNFNYKVHVKSQKDATVVVKVFLGPKHDEHGRPLQLSQIHNSVFEIDHFVRELKAGENVIKRNSADSHDFVADQTSYYDAYRHIMEGKHTEDDSVNNNQHYGFPLRFKLPRGSEEGTSFQLYVIVYPYESKHHEDVSDHHQQVHDVYQTDKYPLGYPFDRPVEQENVYHVSNAYVKHVKIYHQVNKYVNHDYEQQQGDYDNEQAYQQYGDHNNYRQYHYQHQNVDQEEEHQHQHYQAHHEEEHQVQQHQGRHGDNHEEEYQVQQHQVQNAKTHNGGVHYKAFFPYADYQKKYQSQGPYERLLAYKQHYYGRYQSPQTYGKHHVDDDQHQDDVYQGYNKKGVYNYNQDYSHNVEEAEHIPYNYQQQHGAQYGVSQSHGADYQKYNSKVYGYQQKHDAEDYGYGNTHSGKYQVNHEGTQGYQGSNYQNTEDVHQHGTAHHHY